MEEVSEEIKGRVAKMPEWLQLWFYEVLAVLNKHGEHPATNEKIAIEIAIVHYKMAGAKIKQQAEKEQRQRDAYGGVIKTIMDVAGTFACTVGDKQKYHLEVKPADELGIINCTLIPEGESE